MTFLSWGLARSNLLYLQYHSVYGHQNLIGWWLTLSSSHPWRYSSSVTSMRPISPNMARWWFTVRGFHTYIRMTCVYERSYDRLKASYLHYHNAYGCKTSQVGVIPQGALTHKFPSPFNGVLMEGHMVLYILYYYVIYIIYPPAGVPWVPNWARCWLTVRGSHP